MDIKDYNDFFKNAIFYCPEKDCKITCLKCNTSNLMNAYGYKTYDMCVICYAENKSKYLEKYDTIDLNDEVSQTNIPNKPKCCLYKFMCCNK